MARRGLVKWRMQSQTTPRPHGVPESFYSKFGKLITAVLSGFDRIRFRASLRMLYQPAVMERYLGYCGVKLKEFKSFAEGITAKVKAAAYQAAAEARRPVEYLCNGQLSKEELARELACRDKIKQGLIAIFSAVEPGLAYSLRGDPKTKRIKLVLETRKCTHFYHYYLHEQFGLTHVRVQSWLPFNVDVCLNARAWLARQMDSAGIDYDQRDNCFVWISDPAGAQEGELSWQGLRRGVADLWRRAQVSEAANERYLEALASVTASTPLYQEAQSV